MMKPTLLPILFLNILLYLLTPSCRNEENTRRLISTRIADTTIDSLINLHNKYVENARYDSAEVVSSQLIDIAGLNGDKSLELFAYAYRLESLLLSENYADAQHALLRADSLLAVTDSAYFDSRFGILGRLGIYQSRGIYLLMQELDFEKAIDAFNQGEQLAWRIRDYQNYAILGSNRIIAYYLRQDTVGEQYAREIYNHAMETRDPYVHFAGAYTSALMFYLKEDFSGAGAFVEEAINISQGMYMNADVWALYASVLHRLGRDSEARLYYHKALEGMDGLNSSSIIEIELAYGTYLLETGDPVSALDYFEKAIDLSLKKNCSLYLMKLYEGASVTSEQIGEYRAALDYEKSARRAEADFFNIQGEKKLAAVKEKYLTEKFDYEIAQRTIQIERRNHLLFFCGMVKALLPSLCPLNAPTRFGSFTFL